MHTYYGCLIPGTFPADISLVGGSQLELPQAKSPKSASARRSQRLLLTVHIIVSGKLPTGLPFAEDTVTQVVNAHGALILLKQMVTAGDRLLLRNVKTGEEIGCKVVDIGELQDRKSAVGIEVAAQRRSQTRYDGAASPARSNLEKMKSWCVFSPPSVNSLSV